MSRPRIVTDITHEHSNLRLHWRLLTKILNEFLIFVLQTLNCFNASLQTKHRDHLLSRTARHRADDIAAGQRPMVPATPQCSVQWQHIFQECKKASLRMPWRHIGKRANSSTHCLRISTFMYVSGMKAYGGLEVKLLSFLILPLDGGGRLHTPTTLHLRRRSPVPTEQENEWAPQPVWTLGHCEGERNVLSVLRNEPRLTF